MTSSEGQTPKPGPHRQTLTDAERRALRALLRRGTTSKDVLAESRETLTLGERLADGVTTALGSWRFIAIQSCFLVVWIILNVIGWIEGWDPYPFILLNLMLSFQAAYSAPIIMMSQNRQAAKDRIAARHDYEVNLRAEMEVALIHARLDELVGEQWQQLMRIQREQVQLLRRIEELTEELRGLREPRPL